jgi:hypothetical protein
MFASILAALTGTGATGAKQGTDSDGDDDGSTATSTSTSTGAAQGGLADMLTKLVSALDTNGDGQLSAEELKAGAQALQGTGGAGHHHRPDNDGDDAGPSAQAPEPASGSAGSTAKDAAKSLYESLFYAVASAPTNAATATSSADVAQKFLSALQITA